MYVYIYIYKYICRCLGLPHYHLPVSVCNLWDHHGAVQGQVNVLRDRNQSPNSASVQKKDQTNSQESGISYIIQDHPSIGISGFIDFPLIFLLIFPLIFPLIFRGRLTFLGDDYNSLQRLKAGPRWWKQCAFVFTANLYVYRFSQYTYHIISYHIVSYRIIYIYVYIYIYTYYHIYIYMYRHIIIYIYIHIYINITYYIILYYIVLYYIILYVIIYFMLF